jgi:hypothetical protein
VTGDRKCYNTRATCQDLQNFEPELFTFRFTRPSAQIHRDAGPVVIPSVEVVRVTPQVLAPGVSLGNTSTGEPHHVELSYNEIRNFQPTSTHAQGILHFSGTDTAICLPSGAAPNTVMTVSATSSFDPPLFKMFSGGPLNLHHQEVVRVR